jgi:hypothetical protein
MDTDDSTPCAGKIGGDEDVKRLWAENKEVDAWAGRMEAAFDGHAKKLLN